MMPVVKSIAEVDRYNDEMQTRGYDPKGENGIQGRRYFQKGGNKRTHHIHIYEIGNSEIERHLAFRDYLNIHESEKLSYEKLKENLANRFPYDIDSYIEGKDQLLQEIEIKALKWYRTLNI